MKTLCSRNGNPLTRALVVVATAAALGGCGSAEETVPTVDELVDAGLSPEMARDQLDQLAGHIAGEETDLGSSAQAYLRRPRPGEAYTLSATAHWRDLLGNTADHFEANTGFVGKAGTPVHIFHYGLGNSGWRLVYQAKKQVGFLGFVDHTVNHSKKYRGIFNSSYAWPSGRQVNKTAVAYR